jgi:hypothetical protein
MKLIFTSTLILLFSFAKGQTKKDTVYQHYHEINGISIFKIGETKERILHTLIDSMHYSGVKEKNAFELSTFVSQKLNDKTVYKGKISIDTANFDIEKQYETNVVMEIEMFTPGIEKYFIKQFPITNEIALKNVEFFFLNDSLCYVKMDWDKKIEDALNLKYGESNSTFDEKVYSCTYTYTGAKFEKKGSTFTNRWVNKDNKIQVFSYANLGFDEKCEQRLTSWIEIYEPAGKKRYNSGITYFTNWENFKKGKKDEKTKKQLEKF